MGTRHLTIVKYKDEIKVAQYGQWDGYPNGAGSDIYGFLRVLDLDKFKKRISLCEWLSPEEANLQIQIVEKYTPAEPLPNRDPDVKSSGFISMEQGAMMKQLYPETHRDTGSKILNLIMGESYDVPTYHNGTVETYKINSEKIKLEDSLAFAKDRIFCEWAWVIDLDSNQLQVYTGQFNYDGPKGIFEEFENPVRLLTTFDINDLPLLEDQFLAMCQEPELTEEEALEFIANMTKE